MRERLPAFERMLWRACRGNVFLRQAMIEAPLEDPSSVSDFTFSQNRKLFIIFSLPGRQCLQVRLHHLLPRRPAQDSRQEDLRRIPRNLVSMPGSTSRPSRDGNGRHDKNRRFEHRLGTDSGPSSPCSGRCGKELEELVREGSQNQGDLPHAELVQLGRDTEMSNCGMLGASPGH